LPPAIVLAISAKTLPDSQPAFFTADLPPAFAPKPTVAFSNPTENLTLTGLQCLDKCKAKGGISCKKWNDYSITCC
jgi:hypothetical protein